MNREMCFQLIVSRARCVDLQYPFNATRGVKAAKTIDNSSSKLNGIVVTTPLQERETGKYQTSIPSCSTSIYPEVSTNENVMFYGQQTKMECEKYQDCSWFQEKPNVMDSTYKSLLAESNSDTELNAIGLRKMHQFATKDHPLWGDEYLEVFNDDILVLDDEGNKNNISPSNENYSTINYEMGDDDSVNNMYNLNNYIIRKTDSMDFMKDISSTDPAEVVPISYQERINNPNYNMNLFDDFNKSEVKEEPQMYSPGSNTYLVESDDSDLGIGREEVVIQDENSRHSELNSSLYQNSWENVDPKSNINEKMDTSGVDSVKEVQETKVLPEVTKQLGTNVYDNDYNASLSTINPSLRLDLTKTSYEQEQPLNTPDHIDFMDLVRFITDNERSEPTFPAAAPVIPPAPAPVPVPVPTPVKNLAQLAMSNPPEKTSVKEKRDNSRKQTYLAIPRQVTSNSPEDQKLPKMVILNNTPELSTINLDDVADSQVSIAERIKTGSNRRKKRRYKFEESEDDGDFQPDDDDDEDEDYHDEPSTSKRKFIPSRKRSRSSWSISSESSVGSKKAKDQKDTGDRYRELRDKNNEASRKSRQNRKDKERDLFKTLEETERRNVQLKARSEELEKLVNSLRNLLLQAVLKNSGAT